MNPIRQLAGQTAIYGLPTIIGRFLQYLLVILLTRIFTKAEYGTISVFYSYASFLMVILTYGMETAFFRFSEKETDKNSVFSTGMISLLFSSVGFVLLVSVFSPGLARWIDYPDHPEYVLWFAWILGLDALAAIPYAWLRSEKRAGKFAFIRFTNIFLNIGLTLFFLLLCPWLDRLTTGSSWNDMLHSIYRKDWGIEYVFLANLAASLVTLLQFLPLISRMQWKIHPRLWRKMLAYALPLLFAGLAGMVNETFDRLLLRYLLPGPGEFKEAQVGIYSACYKISILITLFVQAYKFAAEPFFFSYAREKDSKQLYARIMTYFVIMTGMVFLVTLLFLDDLFIRLIGKDFREGRAVIPVLMMANIFLGIYYNLSIWYKLTGKTLWGAWISVVGALITLGLNFWWIPLGTEYWIHGYIGSAWATFFCYGTMMVLAYLLGQKFYPIPYNLRKITGYLLLAMVLYGMNEWIHPAHLLPRIMTATALLAVYSIIVYYFEKQAFVKDL